MLFLRTLNFWGRIGSINGLFGFFQKNRFQSPLNKSLRAGIKTVISCLEKQINKIEESIYKIVDENKDLSRKKEILMTVPGIPR